MRKMGFVSFILLACLSCSPPFNADLSLAAITLSRLSYQSVVDTGIQVWPDSPKYDAVFMPVKATSGTLYTIDPTRGFVLLTSATNQVSLMYIEPDGHGGYTKVPDPASSGPFGIGTLVGRDPNYPGFEMRTVPEGPYAAIFSYDSLQPTNSSAVVMQANGGSFTQIGAQTFSGLLVAGTPSITGASVLGTEYAPSKVDVGSEGMYWLVRDSVGSVREAALNTVNFSGFSGATVTTPLTAISTIFSGLNRCLYYHDATAGVSYASFYAAGAWQCWRWEPGGASFQQLTGITSRIDALLTTGELLSTQDGVGRLFDPQGNLLTTFPFGALRYSMEAYVNGTATVFLSRSFVTHGSLSLELYSIPTSRLKSLSY